MKRKIVGIFVCMLLLITVLPVSSAEEPEPEEIKFRTIMFARGRIEDLSDEVVNGIESYKCTAVNVKVLFIYIIGIIPVGLQREHLVSPDTLYIPKDMFHGILTEGYVAGLIEWWY